MTDTERWRRYISAWVVASCVSAVLCCWLLSSNPPMRYEFLNKTQGDAVGPGQALMFDRQTGEITWTDFGQPFGVIKPRAEPD